MAGKILIADDVATNRIVLKVKLASAYYETVQAANGAETLRVARTARPDLILLAADLPDMSGTEVCRQLKSDPATRAIPVIVISARRDDDRRLDGIRAGADDVCCKPVDELVLLARIRSLLRAAEARGQLGLQEDGDAAMAFAEPAADFAGPGLIGLVAARMETALAWKRALQPHLADRLLVLDRDAALSEPDHPAIPDVFLVAGDLGRPGDGLRFMSELRSGHATRHAAICLVLPASARDASATALDLGASDLIDSAALPAEIALRLQAQLRAKRLADRLRSSVADGLRLAMIDPLTGLHNRRYGLPHLARIADRAATDGRTFGVLVMDLDRFKAVNDSLGHAAGDAVLAEVAARLSSNLRPGDMVARIGGEEFLVVLPDLSFDAARATAERLRRLVCDQPVRLPAGRQVSMTLSIGLAMGGQPGAASDPEGLMEQADQALRAAKSEGRNQVTVHESAA